MTFTIRRASIEDADDIAHVQTESWKTTYAGIVPDEYLQSIDVELRRDRWREQLVAASSETFVAQSEAGVVGFVSGGRVREAINGYDGELYAIYLLREHQGRGVGRRLVEELAAALRHRGFRRMAVWVLEKNPAVGFYACLGGVPVGRKSIEIGGVSLEELAFGIGLDDTPSPPGCVD